MLFTLQFNLDTIYKNQAISIYNVSLDNLFSNSHSKLFQNLKSEQFQNMNQFPPFQHLRKNILCFPNLFKLGYIKSENVPFRI